jgi:hypothetical protein
VDLALTDQLIHLALKLGQLLGRSLALALAFVLVLVLVVVLEVLLEGLGKVAGPGSAAPLSLGRRCPAGERR